jgi:hypothetical protein
LLYTVKCGLKNKFYKMKHIMKFNESLENEKSITDFIQFLNTDKKVLVYVNGDWLEANVLGIDIPNNRLLVDVIEAQTRNLMWKDLYFQLNKNQPKSYRVKFI